MAVLPKNTGLRLRLPILSGLEPRIFSEINPRFFK